MTKILNDKIIEGRIITRCDVCPPGKTWSPAGLGLSNDYYPKYVVKDGIYPKMTWGKTQETRAGTRDVFAGNTDILAGRSIYQATINVYKQKTQFESLELEWDDILVEPGVNGWAVSFENTYVFYNGEKIILNQTALENQNVTFADEFYRFADMYSFEDRIEASEREKREFLQDSWTY